MSIVTLHPLLRNGLNGLAIVGSASLCLLLSPTRLSGMEILGVGPSWLVMWTIVWSLRRSLWHAVTAAIILGLIQDAMTIPTPGEFGTHPSHVVGLTTVAVLTYLLRKSRYLDDAILPVAIATFLLAIVNELMMGLQYLLHISIDRSLEISLESLGYLWTSQSPVISIAAILSGLWMPILYYPLHTWWQKMSAVTVSPFQQK
jgi:rod shape-determining protein MreD